MKGKADKCRKARGDEWNKALEKHHDRPSTVISYTVNIDQLNIYLAGNSAELPPRHGKFEVYKSNFKTPGKSKRRNNNV